MTDGRFSGGTHGFCVGHIAPEAVDGGPIAFVADGDRDRRRRAQSPHRRLGRRRPSWTGAGHSGSARSPDTARACSAKYARLVTGAERGAVTEP